MLKDIFGYYKRTFHKLNKFEQKEAIKDLEQALNFMDNNKKGDDKNVAIG